MADDELDRRVPKKPEPTDEQVRTRASSLGRDDAPPEDAERSARALLRDSEARTEDPAARDLDDERIDRRTSDETTFPVERDETEDE